MAGDPAEGDGRIGEPLLVQPAIIGSPGGISGTAHRFAQLASHLPPADIIQLPPGSGGGYLVVRRRTTRQGCLEQWQRPGAAPPSPKCPNAVAGLPAQRRVSHLAAPLPAGRGPRHERRYQRELAALQLLAASLPHLRVHAGAQVAAPAAGTGGTAPQQPTAAGRLTLRVAALPGQPEEMDSTSLAPGSPSPQDAPLSLNGDCRGFGC